jgi:cellulose synthase/poly-beta-1,6-N-acetylglucosamine synthase-like glycosyltransferase
MISIIITSYKEPKTIGTAIESIISQKIQQNYELIISAPDDETLDIVKRYSKKNKRIKIFKDPGKGKTTALNLILPKIKGEIIILTDGDVFVSENSINLILNRFKDKKIGCVTGRPVPLEDKKSKYGYWANFLFDAAHRLRKKLSNEKKFLECSGYLWAFRNNIIKKIPTDVAEDSIVPFFFWEKSYKIAYSEESLVFVKNVNNWKEWVSQKIRTSRAHETLNKYVDTRKIPRTKNFWNESKGFFYLFSYSKNFKEFGWSIQLLFSRLYTWLRVFADVYVNKRYHKDKWSRVISTK